MRPTTTKTSTSITCTPSLDPVNAARRTWHRTSVPLPSFFFLPPLPLPLAATLRLEPPRFDARSLRYGCSKVSRRGLEPTDRVAHFRRPVSLQPQVLRGWEFWLWSYLIKIYRARGSRTFSTDCHPLGGEVVTHFVTPSSYFNFSTATEFWLSKCSTWPCELRFRIVK